MLDVKWTTVRLLGRGLGGLLVAEGGIEPPTYGL